MGVGWKDCEMLIEARELVVSYGRVIAVQDVTLEVPPTHVLLQGGNGSGKTTLIRTLLGFIKPRKGEARMCGLDSWRMRRNIRSLTTYITEDDGIHPSLRVSTFLDLLSRYYPWENVERAAEILGFTRGRLEQRYGELSRGWRRRMALLEALASDRSILILDDPLSGLDKEGSLILGEQLENMQRPVIVISHIPVPGWKPEYSVILQAGELVYSGPYKPQPSETLEP